MKSSALGFCKAITSHVMLEEFVLGLILSSHYHNYPPTNLKGQ